MAPSLLSGGVPEAAVSSGEGKSVARVSSSPLRSPPHGRPAEHLHNAAVLRMRGRRHCTSPSHSVLFTPLQSVCFLLIARRLYVFMFNILDSRFHVFVFFFACRSVRFLSNGQDDAADYIVRFN